jgi:predicted anti-sigma-YlaC factor YlaD
LTLIERTRMRLHLMVCEACTNFSAQMALIRRAMRKLGADDDAGPGGDPT